MKNEVFLGDKGGRQESVVTFCGTAACVGVVVPAGERLSAMPAEAGVYMADVENGQVVDRLAVSAGAVREFIQAAVNNTLVERP